MFNIIKKFGLSSVMLMTSSFAGGGVDISFYQKIFPKITHTQEFKIEDGVSKKKNNTQLLIAYNKAEKIGYIREIATSTGCNSACLPVVYTSFYSNKGKFLKILSKEGLTKINHQVLTAEDMAKLEFLVAVKPNLFNSVKHPKEMTDALSGATLITYKEVVVKGAAYSTFRIHLYNLDTEKQLKKIIK